MTPAEINYNNIAELSRAVEPRRRSNGIRVFTILLLAVFFVVLLVGLAAGVAMYHSVANDQLETDAARMQSGLLASSIHANDAMNVLGTGNGPEGRALVLTKESVDGGRYEMRIYLYEGNVVQEYSLAGSAYTPERAQPLLASSTFSFELEGDLLVIRTDQGATNIALRSWQGGAA